jgi:hypothetical protein
MLHVPSNFCGLSKSQVNTVFVKDPASKKDNASIVSAL